MNDDPTPRRYYPDGRDPFASNPPTTLSEQEQQGMARWLRTAADQLALRDWRIYVSAHQAERDAIAASVIRDGSDELWVAVEAGWAEAHERRRRASLTHELLHAHFQRVTRMVEVLVKNELGARQELTIEAAMTEVEEQTIDRLAWAISEFLPPLEG